MSRLAVLINAIPWSKLSRNSAIIAGAALAVYGASELFFEDENSFEHNLVCNDAQGEDSTSSCQNMYEDALDDLTYRGLRANKTVFNACINAEGQCNLTIVQKEGERTETCVVPAANTGDAEPAPGFGS